MGKKLFYHLLPVFTFLGFSLPNMTHAQSEILGLGMVSIFGSFWFIWFLFVISMMGLNIAGIIFWIFMLVDVAKRKFKKEDEKLVWILIVVLTSWIGALVYYFVVKKKEDAAKS